MIKANRYNEIYEKLRKFDYVNETIVSKLSMYASEEGIAHILQTIAKRVGNYFPGVEFDDAMCAVDTFLQVMDACEVETLSLLKPFTLTVNAMFRVAIQSAVAGILMCLYRDQEQEHLYKLLGKTCSIIKIYDEKFKEAALDKEPELVKVFTALVELIGSACYVKAIDMQMLLEKTEDPDVLEVLGKINAAYIRNKSITTVTCSNKIENVHRFAKNGPPKYVAALIENVNVWKLTLCVTNYSYPYQEGVRIKLNGQEHIIGTYEAIKVSLEIISRVLTRNNTAKIDRACAERVTAALKEGDTSRAIALIIPAIALHEKMVETLNSAPELVLDLITEGRVTTGGKEKPFVECFPEVVKNPSEVHKTIAKLDVAREAI